MATQVSRPVLVTLTGPTASGKSFLFNYIRDAAKLPCLISTTTRSPRKGEQEGIDYYFISEEESLRLEKEDLLAELAVYNGVRYGVTKKEFETKMAQGLAFLVCEPGGIDHYIQPALDIGASSYKLYVHTDPEIRMERFRQRAYIDIWIAGASAQTEVVKTFNTYMDRLTTMLTQEIHWASAHQWDRVIFGETSPEENLNIILADIANQRAKDEEIADWHRGRAE